MAVVAGCWGYPNVLQKSWPACNAVSDKMANENLIIKRYVDGWNSRSAEQTSGRTAVRSFGPSVIRSFRRMAELPNARSPIWQVNGQVPVRLISQTTIRPFGCSVVGPNVRFPTYFFMLIRSRDRMKRSSLSKKERAMFSMHGAYVQKVLIWRLWTLRQRIFHRQHQSQTKKQTCYLNKETKCWWTFRILLKIRNVRPCGNEK